MDNKNPQKTIWISEIITFSLDRYISQIKHYDASTQIPWLQEILDWTEKAIFLPVWISINNIKQYFPNF